MSPTPIPLHTKVQSAKNHNDISTGQKIRLQTLIFSHFSLLEVQNCNQLIFHDEINK